MSGARGIGRFTLGLALLASIASCDPEPLRCVPGASVACRCGEALGSTTCDTAGHYRACVCASSCREGTSVACRCEDGAIGLQTCLADDERTACTCEPRCAEGEVGLCPCGESLEGHVTCIDGALSACDCRTPTCVPESTRECVCSGGALSVRRCVGGSFRTCECADAPVVPPSIDAGIVERCSPEPSAPVPLEGLSAPGGWSHPVESMPVAIEARADGYLVATRRHAVVIDRDGIERATYMSDLDIVAATTLDAGGVVIVDRGRLRVLDDALAVRTTHLLGEPCTSVLDIGCGRVLCRGSATVTSYELASGARHSTAVSAAELQRTYGEDLVVGGGPVLLTLRDGSVVTRALRLEPPVAAFGPGPGVVDREGVVRDLRDCADPTLDSLSPCGVVLGTVPFVSRGLAMDGDVAGFLYVVGVDEATSRWSVQRHVARTGELVSRATTAETLPRIPRMLAHDAWGRRVLLAIDPCDGFSECTRVVTTAAYEVP